MPDQPKHPETGRPMLYDPASRRIRSFVTRAGRVSSGQERALQELGPAFCIPYQKELLDYTALFNRQADTILEIGFGMGETTATIAGSLPHLDFIGVEVHTPGVGALLKLIGEKQLKNIRIIQHDAVEVLENMIPDASLAGVHIFFPDPWHKAKHQKRRLVQSGFVHFLCTKLRQGAYLHCATDWENYAEQMLEVLRQFPQLVNQSATHDFIPRPDFRPLTKFEVRGHKLGHGVWDLYFVLK